MANKFKLKQSSVAGKAPATTDLVLGELAINTTDGKLFLKKNVGGVETIVDVTAAAGVSSFNTRTGAVTLSSADVVAALGFTPPSQAGVGASGTWSISISGNSATSDGASGSTFYSAKTAVEGRMGSRVNGQNDAYLYNNSNAWGLWSQSGGHGFRYDRASGTFILGDTSIVTAATAAAGTNTTQLATAAFVRQEINAPTRHIISAAARPANTWFTNTTGKPMWVYARFATASVAFHAYAFVDGSNYVGGEKKDATTAGYGSDVLFYVPPGSIYQWTFNTGLNTPSIVDWLEVY